jgi:hypothetical protein
MKVEGDSPRVKDVVAADDGGAWRDLAERVLRQLSTEVEINPFTMTHGKYVLVRRTAWERGERICYQGVCSIGSQDIIEKKDFEAIAEELRKETGLSNWRVWACEIPRPKIIR